MTIRAYLRISTDKQDHASQRNIIETWAARNPEPVASWTEDAESGKVKWQKRRLADVLAESQPGDTIVVSEISRIARSTLGVLTFFEAATEREVGVIAIAQNLALDKTIGGTIARTIFALVAEIERVQMVARTKAALQARRDAGHKLGRPVGATSECKLDAKRPEIERALAARISKRGIARLVGCSPTTLHAWLARTANPPHDDKTLPLPLDPV